MLEIQGLTKFFGGLEAVSNIDMTVETGRITGLIGPNGAGKTTVFNLLTGVLKPTRGSIRFGGHDITGMKPHNVARRGMIPSFSRPTSILISRSSTISSYRAILSPV